MNVASRVCVRFLVSLAVVVALWASLSRPSAAEDLGPIDGAWEGALDYIHGSGLLQRKYPPQTWRIVLDNNTAHMFIIRDGKLQEVHPGKFKVERLRTNVIVYGVTSGRDNDGEWIESSSFILLQTAPDALGVTSAGAVNNANLPLDRDISKFFSVQTGIFHRVK